MEAAQSVILMWLSDLAGDMAEYRAIRAALPGSHVRMNGTKSMIGHLLGAAGAVEAIATVQAIRTGTPPSPPPADFDCLDASPAAGRGSLDVAWHYEWALPH